MWGAASGEEYCNADDETGQAAEEPSVHVNKFEWKWHKYDDIRVSPVFRVNVLDERVNFL
jgi:hypothetical protein